MPSSSREPGAPATAGGIPLCVPELRGNEWAYVKQCLDTNFVSSVGPFVTRFEEAIANYVGRAHAVATVNGTAALHVALLVCGVEPDDEVLVSTLTFIAPVNAIRYVGAWPVFVDAEPQYWQMDVGKAVEFLERGCDFRNGELRNRASGRRVRALLPVHILGHPVEMGPLLEAARRFGLPVIEDATESLGARYEGRTVGQLGDVACFSFNGNKLITTGAGGMLVTGDPGRAARAKYLTTQAKDDPLEYVHGTVGFNYRLSNVQAALGVAQMESIDEFVAAKRRIAAEYSAGLDGVPGIAPMRQAPWAESVFWLYSILVDGSTFGMTSRALLRNLDELGIQTRPLWQPGHLSPAHRGAFATDCSVAERLNRDALSLPCSVGLAPDAQARVIEAISAVAATA